MATHGRLGKTKAFPVVMQLLTDRPEGMTVQEIADFLSVHHLVDETVVDGTRTINRVRDTIDAMDKLGFVVEADQKGGPSGRQTVFKIDREGVQKAYEEGLLNLLEYIMGTMHRFPQVRDGDTLLADLKDTISKHKNVLGIQLRDVGDEPEQAPSTFEGALLGALLQMKAHIGSRFPDFFDRSELFRVMRKVISEHEDLLGITYTDEEPLSRR